MVIYFIVLEPIVPTNSPDNNSIIDLVTPNVSLGKYFDVSLRICKKTSIIPELVRPPPRLSAILVTTQTEVVNISSTSDVPSVDVTSESDGLIGEASQDPPPIRQPMKR